MVKEKKIRKVFEEIYQEQLAKHRRGGTIQNLCRYRPGMVNLFWASLCEHVWCVDVGYPLIRGAKISWYSKGRTVPLNLTFRNKK